MREFKFRAWDDHNKQWLMGYELPRLRGFSLIGECVLFGEWGKVFDEFIFERNGKTFADLKIMQFTGAVDKAGECIYEGDIVDDGNGSVGEVVWLQDSCQFLVDFGEGIDLQEIGKWCTVVGNIFDNPELSPIK